MNLNQCANHGYFTGDSCPICNLPAMPGEPVQAPKIKQKRAKAEKAPKAVLGLHGDTKTYAKGGVVMFRILDDRIAGEKANQVLFESSREDTRDKVLARMLTNA